jgi:hypothetical protein
MGIRGIAVFEELTGTRRNQKLGEAQRRHFLRVHIALAALVQQAQQGLPLFHQDALLADIKHGCRGNALDAATARRCIEWFYHEQCIQVACSASVPKCCHRVLAAANTCALAAGMGGTEAVVLGTLLEEADDEVAAWSDCQLNGKFRCL